MVLPERLLSGTVVSVAGRGLGTVLSVLTIGVVTRSLSVGAGVDLYGTYAAIFAVLGVLAVVADGGLSLTFIKRAARADVVSEARLLRLVLGLRLLTLALATTATVVFVTLLPYPAVVRSGVLLGSLGIASQLVSQLLLGVFQKRLRMFTPAAAEVAGRAATLAAVVYFARLDGGIPAFVGAFVFGSSVTLLWHLAGISRFLPWRAFQGPAAARPRDILSSSWPLALMLLCSLIVFRADSLLLSLLRPAEDLGWYALPYKILESLLFFPAMIGGLLFPALSRTGGGGASETFVLTVREATSLFLLLAIPLVVLLAQNAPWIITILGGSAFRPSIPVLRILAVALGALFFGNLYGNSAIALGAQRALLLVAALLALLNVGVNLWVIPRYSFLGAAWTTLGTEFLSALTAATIVMRRVRASVWATQNWHIVSAGVVFLGIGFLPLPPLLRGGCGLAAYVGVLWLLGVWTPARVRALLRAPRFAPVVETPSPP